MGEDSLVVQASGGNTSIKINDVILVKVNINDKPSFNLSLFDSKTSEKINSSKTLLRSLNLRTA